MIKKYALVIFIIFCNCVCYGQYKKINNTTWQGTASYYSNSFNGKKTASGAIFSNAKLSAANNFLKLGTKVKITNLKNGKCVVVTINDRMNARNKRLLDVSKKTATELGFGTSGLCKVEMEVL